MVCVLLAATELPLPEDTGMSGLEEAKGQASHFTVCMPDSMSGEKIPFFQAGITPLGTQWLLLSKNRG